MRFKSLSGKPETIIASGLEDPRHVAVDASGNILITDRGTAHQVKRFTSAGKLIGTIGKPGEPAIGPYDPLHLNNPSGVAVDSQGRMWVAEADNYPRRVSLWSAKGELVRAFYGPTEYGGGGVLDPQDRSRFFYKGLEFKLDWQTGTDQLVRVFCRPDPLLHGHYGNYSPDTPLYPLQSRAGTPARPTNAGRRYFTSCYTHNPTNGDDVAFLWLDGEKQARLVAGLGNAHSWPVLREAEFRSRWPQGSKPEEENPRPESLATFSWTDANNDGRPQPAEVQFINERSRGVTVMNDLSFVVAQFGDRMSALPPRSMPPACRGTTSRIRRASAPRADLSLRAVMRYMFPMLPLMQNMGPALPCTQPPSSRVWPTTMPGRSGTAAS